MRAPITYPTLSDRKEEKQYFIKSTDNENKYKNYAVINKYVPRSLTCAGLDLNPFQVGVGIIRSLLSCRKNKAQNYF